VMSEHHEEGHFSCDRVNRDAKMLCAKRLAWKSKTSKGD